MHKHYAFAIHILTLLIMLLQDFMPSQDAAKQMGGITKSRILDNR
jgi:hypothetical protein